MKYDVGLETMKKQPKGNNFGAKKGVHLNVTSPGSGIRKRHTRRLAVGRPTMTVG